MDHTIEALVSIELPVDLNGEPFYLYSTPKEDGAIIKSYNCSCGKNFQTYDEAKDHSNQ